MIYSDMYNEDYHFKLQIIKSLFIGREDIFAIRWEKNEKSGYMPAYQYDPYLYKLHRMKGGSFKDYKNKSYQPLTDAQVKKHLKGEHFIGIYPLLQDNTSWFIAADFDKENWQEECSKFQNICRENSLPSYLERSRSGKGGHVWIFFKNSYPAFKSRKIIIALLEKSGIFSVFDKSSSFDRLFPNQDYLSGKGLGNLIALPLQGKSVIQGNTCFIDAASLKPCADQWEFISQIEKVTIETLDHLYETYSKQELSFNYSSTESASGKLKVRLSNHLSMSRFSLPSHLISYLKDELNFLSSAFLVKKKLGKNTWGTERYFNLIEEMENEVRIPRGMTGKLLRYCQKRAIEFEFIDERKKLKPVSIAHQIELREYQQTALEATRKKDFGVMVAPPGSGKTIMALAIIAEKQQPALIIVHRKQLAVQWTERIQSFLGIPKKEIGIIGQGKAKPGQFITVATIQSLGKLLSKPGYETLDRSFGTIIVDECHHIPAKTYREVISKFHAYYQYGLTATPFRKHNDKKLIFIYLGDIIVEVKPSSLENHQKASIIIRETALEAPFNPNTDASETLSRILIHDSARNRLILDDVEKELNTGKKVVIITERKEHIDTLHQYLKQSFEVITLCGEDAASVRQLKWKQLDDGHFQVLITTGQYFGEGSDLHTITCLFLVYPFSFEGKLIQYIGRVQRAEITPLIYDYRDHKIDYLEKLFQKRNAYYRKLQRQDELIEHQEVVFAFDRDKFHIYGWGITLSIDVIELPNWVKSFKPNIRWLVRVLNMEESEGLLYGEILKYSMTNEEIHQYTKQVQLNFNQIRKVKFRSVDTGKLLQSVMLRKPEVLENNLQKETLLLQETIKKPIEELAFKYGSIAFKHQVNQLNITLEFEVENLEIRPEFEVLKPYFARILKKKDISIQWAVEVHQGKILSKMAFSSDLDKINQEVIDSVKFRFVTKGIFHKKHVPGQNNLLDIKQVQGNTEDDHLLYESEEALLDAMLKIQNIRHNYQLRYLARKHDRSVLKVRFVLAPFSFVFLISGKQQYHLIWETLDTEEATYLWHIDKDKQLLQIQLNEIDADLNRIRNQGRQAYLENPPDNFSRIVHDYSDERKGFVVWKNILEEQLV